MNRRSLQRNKIVPNYCNIKCVIIRATPKRVVGVRGKCPLAAKKLNIVLLKISHSTTKKKRRRNGHCSSNNLPRYGRGDNLLRPRPLEMLLHGTGYDIRNLFWKNISFNVPDMPLREYENFISFQDSNPSNTKCETTNIKFGTSQNEK